LHALPNFEEIVSSLNAKKNELRQDETDGHSVPGGPKAPETLEEMLTVPVGTVFKRQWKAEASAVAFAGFLNTLHGCFVATAEEQV
jgi:hypothetical protein